MPYPVSNVLYLFGRCKAKNLIGNGKGYGRGLYEMAAECMK